jgi:hypothetical protein
MLQGVCGKSECPLHILGPYSLHMPQFSREIVLHPEIILNRLKIYLNAEISRDALRKLVEDLCGIYSKSITSRDQIRSVVALPCAMMSLRARVIDPPKQWKTMFVRAEGTEDNIRFVPVDTPTPS